jgi:PAS domain S-box-containing protein
MGAEAHNTAVRMRLRLIAPVLLVLAVTATGFLVTRSLIEREKREDARHRAEVASAEIRGGIDQASNLVESLRLFLLGDGDGTVTNDEFSDVGARWLSPVGLAAAAWVELHPKPRGASLRARLVTGVDPMTAPGIELGRQKLLLAAVENPRARFRVTATPLVRVPDGRSGLFLVQSAPRLGAAALEPGYVVVFVPGAWLLAEVTEETSPKLAIEVGQTSYGFLGSRNADRSTFSAGGQRFDVLVPREPLPGADALLPWLVLGTGLALAALTGALAALRERRLHAQHEVDRIFTLSPDPIAVVGPDGYFRRVNPAFESLLGYSTDELGERPVLDFVHPDDRERSLTEGEALHRDGATVGFENRYVCSDGSSRWLEWTIALGPEGLVYAVARDVTDRRQSEREQAALRRVATLVADGTPPEQVFDAAAREVAHALGIDMVTIDRYDPDGASTVIASFSDPGFPVGSRWPLDGPSLGATVLETARPARIEDYADLQSSSAAVMRERSVSSAVGAPILVDGRPWGVICVSTAYGPSVPDAVEARLADFTELLATSIARTSSRETLARIAEEQAALRRVATLVAEAAAPSAVLDAVAGEMQALLDADQVALNRFEPGAEIVVLAHRGLDVDRTPVGSRVSHEGENVTSIVRRTGSPARMENYEEAGGALAELARATGLRSSVSAPIIVEGQIWGVVTASWKGDKSPPTDTEDRMAKFAHLIDTAIANTEARAEVEQLAEEQAALRRVATLVARGDPPDEIFSAVSREVHRMFGLEGGDFDVTTVVRFDPGPVFVLVSSGKTIEGLPLGSRWGPNDIYVTTRVHRTGRSARVHEDELLAARQPAAAELRHQGVASQVASPIVVEGRLWGAMNINATRALPSDTEERLEMFTELVATAIANAESRKALAEVVEEQTALRRLATLVAEGVPSGELFSAVTKEVVHVFSDVDPALVASVIRFDPGPESILVGASRAYQDEPLGARWEPKDLYVSTRVLRTGNSARVDEADLDTTGGADAEMLRLRGFLYQVGSPVVVEGELWGAMCLNSEQELPLDTDERLASFVELIATAIANAESRKARAVLTEEQGALRRVATLVARDAPSTEVFEAVATEVGKLLDTDITVVGRYDGDGAATAIGSWSASGGGVPVGTRSAIGGHNVLTIVAETGKPARVDGYEDASGEAAEIARRYGWRSSIAAPIGVEDRLWGVMLVATQRPELFPAGAEERLAAFTDLVATAVANTEARHALERVAAEQAALRRVATLVAQGASPQDLFDAVAEEVGRLLPAANVSIGRYESDDSVTSMASWSSAGPVFTPGVRWPIKGTNVAWMVLRTGRPARIDDFSAATDPIGVAVREAGYKSAIGSPIVVEGHLWGAISAASTEGPMPPGGEARLASFTELVATAIANAESSAELVASRRRIVAASDDARRRIERDLHDGVQQQLVSLSLEVGRMEAGLPAGDALKETLGSVSENVGSILDSLGEIARGIHPSILSQGGLETALNGLARRSAVPVEIDARIEVLVPDEVEVAAYYVASEALTNVAKHACASVVHVAVTTDAATLTLVVRDDGVGGAALGEGSGLVGLQDRVEALGGTIAIDSSAGEGTCVVVTLPIATEPEQEIENVLVPPQELESPTR